MANHQENLKKIAQEFVMMEEMYSRMRRMERDSVQNPWRNFGAAPIPKTIDSNQAAKKYGGVLVMEGRRIYRL
ncbi:hypothetical protein SASPL_112604 [Salvia splendens]|uniref:Uncharacterized protein n=1 Tax=Salvia splendens TaxID=180675 RepID=A0A8X9A4R3_SALSN|nr:hypothetical protein SASPL_112604 [Salvia splendens]